MKLLMLVNPHAGVKRGRIAADASLKAFREKGINVDCRISEYPGHLIEIAEQEVNNSWDGIVAVGGDGTLFEIINGMMNANADLPVPLGIIPVGTGNSFCKDLNFQTIEDAIYNIVYGNTRDVDLGKCICENDSFCFINIMGFGFVADVAKTASAYKKLGALSYVIGVFQKTVGLASYSLEFNLDGKEYHRENVFVEISNSTKTGGDMIMAPDAKIDDGLLDVVLLNKVSRRKLLSALPKIFKGTHVLLPEVETFTAKEMTFKPAVLKTLTPDGEIRGNTPITVSVLPGKLRVFDA